VLTASAGIARSTPFADTWVVVVVGVLALFVVVEPKEHLGGVVMAIVIIHWLAVGPAVDSPWAMALAAALLVFHALVAFMAATPHAAVIERPVLASWLVRTTAVGLGGGVAWVLVVAFEQFDLSGSVVRSTAAFALLALAVVVFRVRTAAPSPDPDADHAHDDHRESQNLAG